MPYKDRAKRLAYLKRWRQENAQSGVCVRCAKGTPAAGKRTCAECLDYITTRRKLAAEEGRCVDCGSAMFEVTSKKMPRCPICVEVRRQNENLRNSLD